MERLHVAAQLTGGHAHLMHRIPLVAADLRVPLDHLGHVRRERIDDRSARGALRQIGGRRRHRGGVLGIAQCRGQLRRAVRRRRPGDAQHRAETLEQLRARRIGGHVAEQLDFPLAPRRLRAARQQRCRGDVVVAELRDGGALRVLQDGHVADVVHPRDRAQRMLADDRAHRRQQRFRDTVDGIGALALHGALRQVGAVLHAAGLRRGLQVPTLVRAAGAAAQRPLRPGQPQVRGVDVHRRHFADLHVDARDARDEIETGCHGLLRSGELHLDLEGRGGLGLLPLARGSGGCGGGARCIHGLDPTPG